MRQTFTFSYNLEAWQGLKSFIPWSFCQRSTRFLVIVPVRLDLGKEKQHMKLCEGKVKGMRLLIIVAQPTGQYKPKLQIRSLPGDDSCATSPACPDRHSPSTVRPKFQNAKLHAPLSILNFLPLNLALSRGLRSLLLALMLFQVYVKLKLGVAALLAFPAR